MIRFQEVTFRYPGRNPIVKDVSFQIEAGEYAAIIGPNGSGKSTVALLMNGLLRPASGTVHYGAYSTAEERDLAGIRQKVGIVFQNPEHQIAGATVYEDVAFGMQNLRVPAAEIPRRAAQALEQVELTVRPETDVNALSGGQKQRLAIAGILAMEPEAIVFDEASSMLDPVGKERLLGLIDQLHRRGVTIVTITHDMEEASRASRVIALEHGTVRFDGTPAEFFTGEYRRVSGITPPFWVEARERLRQSGIPVPDSVQGEDGLAEYLWTFR